MVLGQREVTYKCPAHGRHDSSSNLPITANVYLGFVSFLRVNGERQCQSDSIIGKNLLGQSSEVFTEL